MSIPTKQNKKETHRMISAWVEREPVELLLANNANVSEIIRQALKQAAAKLPRKKP